MLAVRCPVKEVAAALGCSRITVWRTVARSERLRRRIAWERAMLAQEVEARLIGLRRDRAAWLDRCGRGSLADLARLPVRLRP